MQWGPKFITGITIKLYPARKYVIESIMFYQL